MTREKPRIHGWLRWTILAVLVFGAGTLSSFLEPKIGYLTIPIVVVLCRVLLRVFPFFVLFLGYKLGLVESSRQISAFRWGLFFGIITGGILLFGIPETGFHAPLAALPRPLANFLLAVTISGHGWLFPGVLLAIFAVLMIYKVKRKGS